VRVVLNIEYNIHLLCELTNQCCLEGCYFLSFGLHLFPRQPFVAAPDSPNDATGADIVPSPHCFSPSGAHQPGSTCEHLSPLGEMWGHTHTQSSTPTQAIHGPFRVPIQHARPFAALFPAGNFPTNHRSAYSDQLQIRLF